MMNWLVRNRLRDRPSKGIRLRRLGRGLHGSALLLALVFLAASAARGFAEARLTVSLDRDTITLGDSAVLSMTFEDCSPSGDPQLPPIQNITFEARGSSQSFSLINGSMSRKTIYSIELHPTKEGTYVIPAFSVNVDGAVVRSQAVRLKVLKGGAPGSVQGSGTAFLKIVPATNVVYVGQTIAVELQCYCADNVQPQLPQFSSDNFIVGDVPNERQSASRVRVGNGVYNLFSFRIPVTAIKVGAYQLGPATWTIAVLGQRTFFGWEQHQETFNSDTPTIEVRPVPTEGAPPGFSGAVGNFNIAQYDAGPASVGVGDPVTLKIRIAGHGAWDTVALPTNNDAAWREFKTYPPTSKVETDRMQLEGSKYFEQVVTPLNTGVKEIPPFVFSFFDPQQNEFRTINHPGIPLTVHATAATPQPTVVSGAAPQTEQQPEPGEEIVHIKPMLANVTTAAPALIQRPGFLALQVVPPLAWLAALTVRKRKERLANNPRLRRQRQVAAWVRQGLDDLSQWAAANDADKFYATVLQLLQEQLGERLDLPAPAITEAIVDDIAPKLQPGLPELLHELFHACNQYRYTPEHTSQGMASLIPKVKTALESLQAMPATTLRSGLAQGVGLAILLFSVLTARASVTDDFTAANKLYEEGKYPQAAAAYEKICQAGTVSPEIYFNLGNAWLKSDKFGEAIYNYRKAETLAPRDPDIRANLQAARTKAGDVSPALPGDHWTRWVNHLTLNEWTLGTAVAIAAFFFVLTAREISAAFRKSAGLYIGLAGLASLGLGSCLGLAVDQRLIDKSAVVIVPEAVVRLGPLAESQSAFTVHDGAELLVTDSDGEWLQVIDAARRSGWLMQNEVRVVQ
jgi:tetratricopeptide (TPR) repeat protein